MDKIHNFFNPGNAPLIYQTSFSIASGVFFAAFSSGLFLYIVFLIAMEMWYLSLCFRYRCQWKAIDRIFVIVSGILAFSLARRLTSEKPICQKYYYQEPDRIKPRVKINRYNKYK